MLTQYSVIQIDFKPLDLYQEYQRYLQGSSEQTRNSGFQEKVAS